MAKSGRSQGGLIGKINKTSFGKNKVTSITSTGPSPSALTTQPGTRIIDYAVVAGGGSGVVVIKEQGRKAAAPGIWDLNEVYDFVKAGTWTNT